MLTEITVENYRAFAQPTTFELAPITILLGANSSGKSSITRLFPLLNQSLGVRSSAPVLWVTEELDFGSFRENVTRDYTDRPIRFSFSGLIAADHVVRQYAPGGTVHLRPSPFTYEIAIQGEEERTFFTEIALKIYDETVVFEIDRLGRVSDVKFNEQDLSGLNKDRRFAVVPGLFPTFYSIDKEGSVSVASMRDFSIDAIRSLRNYAHQNTSFQTIQAALSGLRLGTVAETFTAIKTLLSRIPTLQKNVDNIPISVRRRIWLSLLVANINAVVSSIQRAVSPDILNGAYLAPVRASAQRYYRRQELAVDRIDPSGRNLAMYLNSLSYEEMRAINEDLVEFFDHTIALTRGEGHISLRLGGKDDPYSDNLADVGFGFSQLIPVIAQVHAAKRNMRSPSRIGVGSRENTSPIIAIEQPELHLHPAYQSRLGEYFVRVATRHAAGEPRFRFVLETHSEPLVNEIASLIGRGKIAASDVKLYLFDQLDGESTASVIEAEVLPDGSIPKWPLGFFTTGRFEAGE